MSLNSQFSLNQVSRSGKTVNSIVSLNDLMGANILKNSIITAFEIPNASFTQGDGGIILNAQLARAASSAEALTRLQIVACLYDDPAILTEYENISNGDGATEGRMNIGGNGLPPFALIQFDSNDAILDYMENSNQKFQNIMAKNFVPSNFSCQEGSKSIYCLLIALESHTVLTTESVTLQLSISY